MTASACLIDERLRDDLLSHLIDTTKAASVEADPFPHVTISGFLPRDVYSELLSRLPSEEDYEPLTVSKRTFIAGLTNRKHYRLENDRLERLPSDSYRFWASVRSALGAVEFKQAVFCALREGIMNRYGGSAAEAERRPGFAMPELLQETGRGRIRPHREPPKKVVTMQISLAQDASQENLGTQFYRRRLSPGAWLQAPRGFEIVKTMPFVPNVAFAFVVLNRLQIRSWHGRSTMAPEAGVRNWILNSWYERAEHGNQDLLAEHRQRAMARAA